MTRKAKGFALAIFSAGVGVLAVAASAYYPIAVDYWFIRKLDCRDQAVRRIAIEALGERRSRRAAPYLLEAYQNEQSREVRQQIIAALIRIDRLEED